MSRLSETHYNNYVQCLLNDKENGLFIYNYLIECEKYFQDKSKEEIDLAIKNTKEKQEVISAILRMEKLLGRKIID